MTDLLDGVTVPLVTAMTPSRTVSGRQAVPLLEALAAAGVTRLMLLGSNGEGPVISDRDAVQYCTEVIATWRTLVPHGTVTVNATSISTEATIERGTLLSEARPDAFVVAPPLYFAHTPAEIVDHYARMADLEAPVLVYNVPSYAGTDLDDTTIQSLALLPHVVGLKDSSRRPEAIRGAVSARGGTFAVSQGDESALWAGIRQGAVGVTPGIANIAPALAIDLYQAARAGDDDRARHLQETVIAVTRMHRIRAGVPTMKAALALRGLCPPFASRPFLPLEPEQQHALGELLHPLDSVLIGSSS